MKFQPGESPSRGLLRDCTTLPINRLHSSTDYTDLFSGVKLSANFTSNQMNIQNFLE